MAKLADLSFAPITGAQLKNAGYIAVGRYLSHSPGKNLTPAQRDDYFANGLGIFLFWEDAAQRALAGFSAGADDARVALDQATTLGFPNDRPIYFTADFDATEEQQTNINAYLDGAASVLGFARVGVYGDYYVVKRALDARKAKWSIQTRAWSGTPVLIDPRIHIFQTAQRDFNDQVDVDESKQDDFGQWTSGQEGGGNVITPQDRIVEAFNNLVGRDPSDAELSAWNSAGQPEPRGWTKAYILGDRHSDVFHQLEQSLSVHDAFDLPRLADEAKQAQAVQDQVTLDALTTQVSDLKAQLAQGGNMNQDVGTWLQGKKTFLIAAAITLEALIKWLAGGDYSLPSILNLINNPALDLAGLATTLRVGINTAVNQLQTKQ